MTQAPAVAAGSLAGIKVLDLSRILAGPWATQILGDLGADVIKVERPGTGDDTRLWGPPFIPGGPGPEPADSAYYLCANRNKRSIAIDFSREEGRQLIRTLAAQSDVVIENFRSGDLARHGLDYAGLAATNPRLVYCSITGFGQDGPYATRPGYDFLIQGMSGLMSITGRPDHEAGGGPMKVGIPLTDIVTGVYSAVAILAAIQARHTTGRGQYIDMSLLDVGVLCLANQAMNYFYGGTVPQRMANQHPNAVPYQDFPTRDGHMLLGIGNEGQFQRFCRAVGRAEWADDDRFSSNAARVVHREELVARIRELTLQRTTTEWIELLERHVVPCGPINTVADVFADPQVAHRGMRITMPHAQAGDLSLLGSPIRLSDTPVRYRQAPPTLGQHSQQILDEWLGLDAGQIDVLIRQGVIGSPAPTP